MRLAGDQSKPLRRSWKTNKGKRMTRKHFEAIARGLRQANADAKTIEIIALEIEAFNPSFDWDRFVSASTNNEG
jgi:hypothetical protein